MTSEDMTPCMLPASACIRSPGPLRATYLRTPSPATLYRHHADAKRLAHGRLPAPTSGDKPLGPKSLAAGVSLGERR
jgi:hypothetical protein